MIKLSKTGQVVMLNFLDNPEDHRDDYEELVKKVEPGWQAYVKDLATEEEALGKDVTKEQLEEAAKFVQERYAKLTGEVKELAEKTFAAAKEEYEEYKKLVFGFKRISPALYNEWPTQLGLIAEKEARKVKKLTKAAKADGIEKGSVFGHSQYRDPDAKKEADKLFREVMDVCLVVVEGAEMPSAEDEDAEMVDLKNDEHREMLYDWAIRLNVQNKLILLATSAQRPTADDVFFSGS